MNSESWKCWQEAAVIDPTLSQLRRSDQAALRRKLIKPQPFSRRSLFTGMMRGQPSVFEGFPVSLRIGGADTRTALSHHIKTGFGPRTLANAHIGSSHHKRMTVRQLMERWEGRAVVSVTDLHFRDTKFERIIDTSALSDFNLLCLNKRLVENLEMMTLVISSTGNLTDTHTDDCDGSNHCFVGKKLWLAWDRMEGVANGFQDVDRDDVRRKTAYFDLRSFLSLPSSKWFIVSENQTLFLPGNLSHKVITLEDYVGVGSFHVTLPGYVSSVRRWILYDTLDVRPKYLELINAVAIDRMRWLRRAPNKTKARWGFRYLWPSIQRWRRKETAAARAKIASHPAFASFINAAEQACIG
ncbi:MAG: hypothetical protein ACXWID_00085 [Pyrinomonadaceae bacterium]